MSDDSDSVALEDLDRSTRILLDEYDLDPEDLDLVAADQQEETPI